MTPLCARRSAILSLTVAATACTAAHPGPVVECGAIESCTVVARSCACDLQSIDGVMAVHHDHVAEHYAALDCASACPGTRQRNPHLQARCDADASGSGTCVAFDIRTDPEWAGCTTNAECRVRTADCCECRVGANWDHDNLIAVGRGFPSEGGRVCDTPCGGCLVEPPGDTSAICADDLCALVLP